MVSEARHKAITVTKDGVCLLFISKKRTKEPAVLLIHKYFLPFFHYCHHHHYGANFPFRSYDLKTFTTPVRVFWHNQTAKMLQAAVSQAVTQMDLEKEFLLTCSWFPLISAASHSVAIGRKVAKINLLHDHKTKKWNSSLSGAIWQTADARVIWIIEIASAEKRLPLSWEKTLKKCVRGYCNFPLVWDYYLLSRVHDNTNQKGKEMQRKDFTCISWTCRQLLHLFVWSGKGVKNRRHCLWVMWYDVRGIWEGLLYEFRSTTETTTKQLTKHLSSTISAKTWSRPNRQASVSGVNPSMFRISSRAGRVGCFRAKL